MRVSLQYSLVNMPEGYDPDSPMTARTVTLQPELRALARAATQDEPFRVVEYVFANQEDMARQLSVILQNRPENLATFCVLSSENQVVATSLNGPTSPANALLIAACTPSTILRLLDNLDAAATRVEELTQELQNLLAEQKSRGDE